MEAAAQSLSETHAESEPGSGLFLQRHVSEGRRDESDAGDVAHGRDAPASAVRAPKHEPISVIRSTPCSRMHEAAPCEVDQVWLVDLRSAGEHASALADTVVVEPEWSRIREPRVDGRGERRPGSCSWTAPSLLPRSTGWLRRRSSHRPASRCRTAFRRPPGSTAAAHCGSPPCLAHALMRFLLSGEGASEWWPRSGDPSARASRAPAIGRPRATRSLGPGRPGSQRRFRGAPSVHELSVLAPKAPGDADLGEEDRRAPSELHRGRGREHCSTS